MTASAPERPSVLGAVSTFFTFGHAANLAPGASSTVLGLESDSYCAARPGGGDGEARYRTFTIAIGGGGAAAITLPGAGLDLTCGLFVTAFADPDYPQPVPVYRMNALRATIVLPPTARPGQLLDYEIDLHNPTEQSLALEPCPGYLEAAVGRAPVKQSYELNCRPVPAIGAGDTVRFSMRLRVPVGTTDGPLRVTWLLLDAPAVTASATVAVVG